MKKIKFNKQKTLNKNIDTNIDKNFPTLTQITETNIDKNNYDQVIEKKNTFTWATIAAKINIETNSEKEEKAKDTEEIKTEEIKIEEIKIEEIKIEEIKTEEIKTEEINLSKQKNEENKIKSDGFIKVKHKKKFGNKAIEESKITEKTEQSQQIEQSLQIEQSQQTEQNQLIEQTNTNPFQYISLNNKKKKNKILLSTDGEVIILNENKK